MVNNYLKLSTRGIFNILFIFAVFLFLFNSKDANATQGSCSDHGGVYCSIGADYDGSVICNDGWKDSSVYYSDADECKQSTCTYPTSSGCKTESDAGALSAKLARNGGYLGQSSSAMAAANQCRAEIDAYQLELQSYQNCVANSSTSSSSSNYSSTYASDLDSYIASKMQEYCVSAYGSQSYYYSTNKTCRCNDGYKFGKNDQCVSVNNYCSELYGINSFYNSSKNGCACNSGYVFDSTSNSCKLPPTCPANSLWRVITNKCYCDSGYVDSGGTCISHNQDCQNKLGPNSYGDASNCYCSAGYEFNGNARSCVLKEIKIDKPESVAIITPEKTKVKNPIVEPKVKSNPFMEAVRPTDSPKIRLYPEVAKKEDLSEVKNTEIKSQEKQKALDPPKKENFANRAFTAVRNIFKSSFNWLKNSIFGTSSFKVDK